MRKRRRKKSTNPHAEAIKKDMKGETKRSAREDAIKRSQNLQLHEKMRKPNKDRREM